MIPLLLVTAWAQPCDKPYSDQDVRGVLGLAEEAFSNVDAKAFNAAYEEMGLAVGCLSEPIKTTTAAKVFLIEGLWAHLQRKPEAVEANLVAFAELEAMAPPTSVAPEGHPIRQAWQKAKDAGPTPRRLLAVPAGGRLWIDGSEHLDLAEERPTIVQLVIDGEVEWTDVVAPGSPLHTYDVAPEETRVAYNNKTVITTRKGHSPVLPVISGVLLAGALGTYLVTTQTSAAYKDPQKTEPEALPTLRRTNNALVVTSVALLGAGVGVAVVAGATW